MKTILPFPAVRQSTKWSCGAAALQMVLRQHGLRVNARSMTLPELKQYLRKKIPVILLLQAWTNRTNWIGGVWQTTSLSARPSYAHGLVVKVTTNIQL